MIGKIRMLYLDFIQAISDSFTADDYDYSFGKSNRFTSVLSVAFRFLLKYLYIVFPVLYVLIMVFNYETGDSILKLLVAGLIATVLLCILIAIAFLVLMFIESFAKIITSLILFNEMPQGAQNPADALLMAIVTRKF